MLLKMYHSLRLAGLACIVIKVGGMVPGLVTLHILPYEAAGIHVLFSAGAGNGEEIVNFFDKSLAASRIRLQCTPRVVFPYEKRYSFFQASVMRIIEVDVRYHGCVILFL